jgi:hypothetical protein
MASSTWAGGDLVDARSAQHVHGRDGLALGALAALAALWIAAGVAAFRPFAVCVAGLAALAAGVELLFALSGGERADRAADDMIVAGFLAQGRLDAVSLAVEARRCELASPRMRRRLVRALRTAVRIELAPPSRFSRQLAALPPVRGLAANAALAELVACRLEQEPCDPRAVVLVARLLEPPSDLAATPSPREQDRRVRGDLLRAAALLDVASEVGSRSG